MPGIEQNLQNLMKRVVDKKEVAGLSILVEKGDQELFYLNEGMADIEKGKKIQRDTIWRLYSQSKPITAAATMLLMERENWIFTSRSAILYRSMQKQK